MIKKYIDHAEKLVEGRTGLTASGFFSPYHPCVISLMLKEKIDIDPLVNVLSFYWGESYAQAVPFFYPEKEEFAQNDEMQKLLQDKCYSALTGTNVFKIMTSLYYVDIIECDAVSDKDFERHCSILKGFAYKNHIVHKILVLLHNHESAVPQAARQYLEQFKNGNQGQLGYDTVFVLSDELTSGGYETNKLRRLTDFMTVLAFNTDDQANLRNTLSGVVGFRENVLTISAQHLKKPNREIAMAALYGITHSLSGISVNPIATRVTERQLQDLFYVGQERKIQEVEKYFNELKQSSDFPHFDVFSYLPYNDGYLRNNHEYSSDFSYLAVKSNFYGCVDRWINGNLSKIKIEFLKKIVSRFSFTDLQDNVNKTIIKQFLNGNSCTLPVNINDYNNAVQSTKQYMINQLIGIWCSELDKIAPRLRQVQNTLLEICQDLKNQMIICNTERSIIDYYRNISNEYICDQKNELRNSMILCELDEQLKQNILDKLQNATDPFFKNSNVFALDYINELRTRMQALTVATNDVVTFVANEIQNGRGKNVYFPPHGLARFSNLQEICVLPNDQALTDRLHSSLPEVKLKQIPAGSLCARIAVVKIT